MTPAEAAAFEFFADVDALFSDSPNPLGRGQSPQVALHTCRANLGQIRRWWERARTQLEEAAK